MNKKTVLILIILGVILVIFIVLSFKNYFITTPTLKFSTGVCDSNINPYSPPEQGILNKNWKNQNTLIVEGYVKTFCGGATITGSYLNKENNLILKYKIKTEDAVTSCICSHKVIYEISNLANKDYSVSIIPE